MAREIERKFLLSGMAWRDAVERSESFQQAYLCGYEQGRASVRVRVRGAQAELNIKSLELGVSRDEYEYAIPDDDARKMIETLAVGPVIEKTRHWVRTQDHLFEVDEFHGNNQGLVVAEVELESEGQPVVKPNWLGPEVTHLPRYFNVALAKRPFSEWTAREQAGDEVD